MIRLQPLLAASLLLSIVCCPVANSLAPTIQRRGARLLAKNSIARSQLPTEFPNVSERPPRSSATSLSSSLATFGMDAAVVSASIAATAKLLTSIGLGGLAAKKENLLDADAIASLSRLAYWVFQPSFLFVSVATTLFDTASGAGGMPGKFLALMLAASAMSLATNFSLSKVVTKVVGFSGDEARDVQMCVTFQNCGPLPLVFADALFQGSLLADVTSCVSFYLLAWSPIFWSVGRMILGTYGASDTTVPWPSRMVTEIKKFLSPPVIGAIMGLVVGSTPFLRQAFFGGVASPLFGALKTLGSAYLPSALLVLAGSLFAGSSSTRPVVNGDSDVVLQKTTTTPGPSAKAALSILLARFAVTPLIAMGLVNLFGSLGLLGPAGTRARAVASFVLLMQGCMPPAQNSVLLYSLSGLKDRASGMAKTLALMYTLAVIPVTILMSACISFSGIAAFR
jgi:predicted permease